MNIVNFLTDATTVTNSGFFNTAIEIVKSYWLQVSALISVPVIVAYCLKILLTLVKNKTQAKSMKQLFDLMKVLPRDLKNSVSPLITDESSKITNDINELRNLMISFAETILSTEANAELRLAFYRKLDEFNIPKEQPYKDNDDEVDISSFDIELDEIIEDEVITHEENKTTPKISLE